MFFNHQRQLSESSHPFTATLVSTCVTIFMYINKIKLCILVFVIINLCMIRTKQTWYNITNYLLDKLLK